MRLILVRHAEAVGSYSSDAPVDFDRALTDLGRQQAAQLAATLHRVGVAPDVVATSPLVRTVQTAEALLPLLPAGRAVLAIELLKSGELRPKKLSKHVAELGVKTVVLVGHMPDIAAYAAWLLGVGEHAVPFEKGAAACIAVRRGEIGEGSGVLEWFVTPAWCEPAGEVISP